LKCEPICCSSTQIFFGFSAFAASAAGAAGAAAWASTTASITPNIA
jgi:hypothetical protein